MVIEDTIPALEALRGGQDGCLPEGLPRTPKLARLSRSPYTSAIGHTLGGSLAQVSGAVNELEP